jgi:phage terminase large subunit-like protein
MPWQELVADVSHELDPATGELWYRLVVVTVPRQSGKTTELLAVMVRRALGHKLPQVITYTAQSRIKAREKWEDEHIPILEKSSFGPMFRVRKTTGNEAIMWFNGSRHGIEATTDKAGHGPTVDLGVIDEAFAHVDSRLEQAFRPSMITRPGAQLWVVSTAGTAKSGYLRGKVNTGRLQCEAGIRTRSAYFDWSAPNDADPADPATWWACMPALGYIREDGTGISEETIRAEFEGMDLNEFRRAYLNQWVDEFPDEWLVISQQDWEACEDRESEPPGPRIAIAADASPDQASGAIAIAGKRADGRMFVGVSESDHRPGVSWIVPRLLELKAKHRPCAIVVDPRSPAAGLIDEAERAGIELVKPGANDVAQAFAQFYTAVADRTLVHRGQPELATSLAGATRRELGDGAFAWARRTTLTDISPLVAITSAAWAHGKFTRASYDVLRSVAPPT